MLSLREILVTLPLCAAAATLCACGQKGDLVIPAGPAAANRTTLPQIIESSTAGRAVRVQPATAASAPLHPTVDPTGTASPIRTP